MKVKEFFINTAKGAAIGVAMIVPGVSGGTLAVLLGIYDKLIESCGNITKKFKESVAFLFPVLLGAVLAFAAMYFPLKYALEYAPFPTITLFAGLMLGSVPDLIETAKGNGFKKRFDIAASIIPFLLVIGISCMPFIPNLPKANLAPGMEVAGYWLLLLIGVVASCALVVPGISGSMLLLLFGYYQPLLDIVKEITVTPGHTILVLAVFAIGLLVGFFTIAKLMQLLLNKFRRGTYWAIVGFVIGSIPAVIITFYTQYGADTLKLWQIILGVVLFIGGAVGSYFLTRLVKKRQAAIAVDAEKSPETLNEETGEK